MIAAIPPPPPRRASTRCRTAPGRMLKSFAILSSALYKFTFVFFEFLIKQGLRIDEETHICRPEKISRCCCGGTPDCSSTFSFMRVI